jgi:hypothetical protein
MKSTFEETERFVTREAYIALLLLYASSGVAFLIFTLFEWTSVPMFCIYIVVFAAIILFCHFGKMKIMIQDNIVHIHCIKKYEIKFEEIIDHKTGDVDILKNYSGWGLKSVKFKNFICTGYDEGVSLKLLGRRVYTFSTSDPEAIVALLPIPEKKE